MPDLGRRVSILAMGLTPDQIGELCAVKWLTLCANKHRTPILKSHYHGKIVGPLVRRKLLAWKLPSPPFQKGQWRMPEITVLGELVLLARAETEMRKTGAMPRDEIEEE